MDKEGEYPKFTGWWHRTFFREGVNGVPGANEMGGEDVWEMSDRDPRGCDKKNHAERSIAHQPNHTIYWNKQVVDKR